MDLYIGKFGFEWLDQIKLLPTERRSMKNAARSPVKNTGDHNSDTLTIGVVCISFQGALYLRCQRRHEFLRTNSRRKAANVADLPSDGIRDHDVCSRRSNVDSDCGAVLRIDIKKCRFSAANLLITLRSLADKPFFEKFIHQQGYICAVCFHHSRKVRSRHRLMCPNQRQRDLSVDLPRSPAGSQCEIVWINLPHLLNYLTKRGCSRLSLLKITSQRHTYQ